MILLSVIVFIAISGCNTSKITTTWKAPYMPQTEYRKILVFGLIHDQDRSVREKMENHFVGDLRELGYVALSSLKEYGPAAFDKMDEKTVLSTLGNSGIDAIITIVLLDKEKESKYISSLTPLANQHDHFFDYQVRQNQKIYEPGYFVINTKYFWETNFYDVTTQRLLYSVQTKTFDPANTESMGHEYGWMIVRNMVKQKVLRDITGRFK